ncbi:MAG: hypothetical protein HC890_07995 [Chloroflexaceae bacterium]|nr:hypothetical protein [Chloroflexaceae bacterium]
MADPLSLCLFVPVEALAHTLLALLQGDRFLLQQVRSPGELMEYTDRHAENIDCLVAINHIAIQPLFNQLYERGILLPVIIIDDMDDPGGGQDIAEPVAPTYFYHPSEVRLSASKVEAIASVIEQAIHQFLKLAPYLYPGRKDDNHDTIGYQRGQARFPRNAAAPSRAKAQGKTRLPRGVLQAKSR